MTAVTSGDGTEGGEEEKEKEEKKKEYCWGRTGRTTTKAL